MEDLGSFAGLGGLGGHGVLEDMGSWRTWGLGRHGGLGGNGGLEGQGIFEDSGHGILEDTGILVDTGSPWVLVNVKCYPDPRQKTIYCPLNILTVSFTIFKIIYLFSCLVWYLPEDSYRRHLGAEVRCGHETLQSPRPCPSG